MTTDPIKALVDLGPELQKRYDSRSVMNPTGSILLTYEEAPTILAAIEALTPMASGTSVVVPVAELQPFADLVSTKNDYDLSTDDEIIRSAGTYGRDYCHITVGDCRRLKDRLHRKG